jgi:hypothetical protein
MKTKIEIEVKPFNTPNVAILRMPMGDGEDTITSIPLKEIDASTLNKLCDDFTDEVFSKAGKSRPVEETPEQDDSASSDNNDSALFPSRPHSKVG